MTTVIDAPVAAVWRALSDIGRIADWNPGVRASRLISDQTVGTGTARHCDLGAGAYLREVVVKWEEHRALTMRIEDTNLPLRSADIRFSLAPEAAGTRVRVSPLYHVKFGRLGRWLDRLAVRRTYRRGMRHLLEGLKRHVESGDG